MGAGVRAATRWLWIEFLLIALLVPAVSSAQNFDSGSLSEDGDLSFVCSPPAGQSFEYFDWDPFVEDSAHGTTALTPRSDSVFRFGSITVPADCVVQLTVAKLGPNPVVWLAEDEVNVAGFVTADGGPGHSGVLGAVRAPSIPGPGGFPGGLGTIAGFGTATAGLGPGGGPVAGFGGGAGHAFVADGGGQPYGTVFLLPLIGGSGGGGSTSGGAADGGGGGAGGGAILVASSLSIRVDGGIWARGGTQGAGSTGCATGRRGGGGSGGSVRLVAPQIDGTGSLNTDDRSCNTNRGSDGRIRIESNDPSAFTGSTIGGLARRVTLSPTTVLDAVAIIPTVRVTAVDGMPVPFNPSGAFLPAADVTINTANPVTVDIAAENVPLGTVVTVFVHSEQGSTRTATSNPLAGTLESSTTQATSVIIDPGFSSVTLRADF